MKIRENEEGQRGEERKGKLLHPWTETGAKKAGGNH